MLFLNIILSKIKVFIELKSKMLTNIEPENFKKMLFITEPYTVDVKNKVAGLYSMLTGIQGKEVELLILSRPSGGKA